MSSMLVVLQLYYYGVGFSTCLIPKVDDSIFFHSSRDMHI